MTDCERNQVCRSRNIARWIFAVGIVAGLLLDASAATTRTWTGNANSFWSEPGNWSPFGAPQEGDALIFPPSATRRDSLNDLTNRHLASMQFTGGGYYLTGGTVFLDSHLTDSHSTTASNRISFFIYFTGAGAINVIGSQKGSLLELYGQVRLNGNTNLNLYVNAYDGAGEPGFLTLRDAIVSGGPVYKSGFGSLYFRSGNPNIYYGGMHLLQGIVHLLGNKPVSEEFGTGYLTIGSNGVSQATVYVGPTPWAGQISIAVNDSHLIFDHPTGTHWLRLSEGALVDGAGSLTVYAGIESRSDVFTPVINLPLDIYPANTTFNIHGANFFALDLQTPIGGPGGIYKTGDGSLLLKLANTFAGNVSVYDGILDAYSAGALGAGTNVLVYGSGSLTLRNADISGKRLDTYAATSLGSGIVGSRLTSIGASSWSGPVVLHTNLVLLGGDMNFLGPISGAGGLALLNGITTLSGPAANTFTGTTLVRNSYLQLNKSSGGRAFSGPLVVGGPFGGPYEVRWLQDYQCVYADVTLFANGVVNLNHRREDFGPVQFNGGTIATGAGELGLYDVVTVNASTVSATISGKLGLPLGWREFRVADGGALMDLQVSATVLGAGSLHKTGPGQMWLNSSNTYGGATLIGEGTLVANAIGALGATASGTVVLDGATLAFNFLNSTVSELISLRGAGVGGTAGALNIQGTATLRSQFPSIYACLDLTTNATVRVENAGQLTADGVISGVGPLIKTGPGALVFVSSHANSYSGDTLVKEGILNLQKPIAVTAIPGHVRIGSGPGGPAATLLQQSSFSIVGQVTVDGGGLWNLTGYEEGFSSTAPPPLTLHNGGSVQSGSSGIFYLPPGGDVVVNPGTNTCTIGGYIGFDGGPHRFVVAPGGSGSGPGLLVTANLSPTGGHAWWQKEGAGFMRFNGINSCTGTNVVAAGRFQMNGSQSSGAVQINSGGRLDGLGGGGWRMIMNGGTVAPGPMPGILQSGTFNQGGGSGTLLFELDSTTPGLSNSKLNCFGAVDLTGLNLELVLNFVPPTNSQFIIVENTSTLATTGNFNGLPPNGTFTWGGRSFSINYAGKTGNDVILTDIGAAFQPQLTIERMSPTSVRLLWGTNDPGLGLQFNTNLFSANWQFAPVVPVLVGTNNTVIQSISGQRKFYRLARP